MKDSDFRTLDHRLGALRVQSRGEVLAPGFKPDITAFQDTRLALIIENEHQPNLKTLFGAYQRAEKYSRDNAAMPSLIVVLAERKLTSVPGMTEKLREFATFWRGVSPPGGLAEILVLGESTYVKSVRRRIPVLSAEFRALCEVVTLRQRPVVLPVTTVTVTAELQVPVQRRNETDVPRPRGDRPDGLALTA
jgi:hypothetical protein